MRLIQPTAFLVTLCAITTAFGQDPKPPRGPRPLNNIEVHPPGDFAEFDTVATLDLLKQLKSSDEKTKTKAIEQIKSAPGKVAPPALCAMSNELFHQGEKDDALFWYYLGQLRARSDANKSNDVSARQAVAVLNSQYGPLINKYAFRNTKVDYKKNLADIKAIAEKVVDWDRKHPREYDPRWISLHGMGAFVNNKVDFEPKDKWDQINEQTRVSYLKDLDEASSMFKEIDANGDGAVSDEETDAYQQHRLAKAKADIERAAAERKKSESSNKTEAGKSN
jgi:hypothetical protein